MNKRLPVTFVCCALNLLADSAQARQQQTAQQPSARNQRHSVYERAFGACMEARGYTVK